MSFFYSAIGLLLFGSIFIINKYILLLNTNKFSETINLNSYSEYKQIDKFFLSTLYSGQDFGEGKDICFNLKREFAFSGISNYYEYFQDDITLSTHKDIINSCVLTDGIHRILIKKNEYSPINYSYNSCILSKEFICSFEEGSN